MIFFQLFNWFQQFSCEKEILKIAGHSQNMSKITFLKMSVDGISYLYPRSPKGEGGILFYLCPSVLLSIQDIFRRIFLSNCWWQKSHILSQASYRFTILWVAFLDPSDSYFLFADFVDFLYTLNIYAHFSSHFSQQLLMAEIWCLVTSLILVPHIVGSVFEPIGFLLPVCRLCWFLYTLNIYAHFSSHFSQPLLMAEFWYLVTSFI